MRPTDYTPEERDALIDAAPALDHSKPSHARSALAFAEAALPAKDRKRLSAARRRLRDSSEAMRHAENTGNADWIALARSRLTQRQHTLARVMRDLGVASASNERLRDDEPCIASMQHDDPDDCALADILMDGDDIVGFRD